jgi:hypothetical protein
MPKKSNHVVPAPAGGWNVKKGGSDRASKHFDKQSQAIDWARTVAREQKGELVIHERDGTIRTKDSYGRDPQPARGKR